MTNSNWKPVPHDLLPCPFCGGNADPTGWLCNDGRRGPECEDCGATAESTEAWNSRATPAQPAAEPDDYESLKQCSAAWRVVVDALFRHGPTGWLDKNKPAMYCAAEAIEELAAAAQPVAVPDATGEREAAEEAYTRRAFDYEQNPVGSRDWTLFWSGWCARAVLATRQPSAQVQDDVDLWAFCRDVLKRGAAIESQYAQQGYETFIAEIEHAARKEDKRLRAMLSAAARKGEV